MTAFAILAGIALVMGLLIHVQGRRERVLTPLALFVAIEVLATWPALAAAASGDSSASDWTLALLAGCATFTAVVAYMLFGGMSASAVRWRDEANAPSPRSLKTLGTGIFLLVAVLIVLSVFRFQGVPPLFNGGLRSLIDPVGNADQVARIREGRRVMTKGYLVGEQYAGQGVLISLSQAGWQVVVAAAVLRHTWVKTATSRWQLVAVAGLAFLVMGSDGKRAPLALALLAAIGALALRRRVPTRVVVASGLAAFVFLLLISPLSKGAEAGGTSISGRAEAVVTRVTQGNGQNNVAIVNLVDSGRLGVGGGAVFTERILVMIPGAPTGDPFALTVTRLAYGANANTTGFSTPTQFGLLYADGRDIGVLIGYIFTGAVMALGWRGLTRIKSYWGAVFMVQGGILLGYMAVTGVQGVISNGAVTTLAIAVMAIPDIRARAQRRAAVTVS